MNSTVGDHRFIFVGGLHGSGASRVTSMLGHHRLVSTLHAPGRPDGEGEELQSVFDTAATEGGPDKWAFSPKMHLTDASSACRPESADELWRSWGPYWDLSKGILVERSAPNLARGRFLQGLFPGAYFIMVMRHPVAMVEATGNGSRASRFSRLEHWVVAHETMADDLPHLEHALILRYEDLVVDTRREYGRMLEFLELPWSPSVFDLRLTGNEAYYRSWARGSPLARMSSQRAERDLNTRVEGFGYSLRPPYVATTSATSGLHERVSRQAGARTESGTGAAPSQASSTSSLRTASLAPPSRPASPASQAHRRARKADDAGARRELRSAARGGFAFTVGIFVSTLFQFGFLTLVAHTLDQSAVGALLEAIAIFTICNNVAELGADTGLFRFSPIFLKRRPQDIRRLHAAALLPALIASVLAAALVYVYAPQLVHIFVHHVRRPGTSTSLRILAFFLPAVTLTTVMCAGLRAWTLRVPLIINYFLSPITRPVIFAGFLVIGVTLKLATIAYVAPIAAGFGLAAIVLATKLRSTTGEPGEPAASWGDVAAQFWRFSLPRAFGAVFQILVLSLDVLLVGAILSTRQAAAYSVASRYIQFSTFALTAIIASVMPQMSRLMDARDYPAVKVVYKSCTWWTIAASWPPLLVLASFSPLFLSLFGHGYVVASSALTILSLAMLASTGTGPNGALLQMAGRSGVILALQATSLVINVGLNLWLIPRLGLTGAAIAWTASILFIATLTNTILWRNFRIEPFGSGYLITAGAVLGCYGVLGLATRLVFGTGVIAFLLYAVVSTVLCGLVLFRFRATLNFDAFESLYSSLFRRVRQFRAAMVPNRAR